MWMPTAIRTATTMPASIYEPLKIRFSPRVGVPCPVAAVVMR